MQEADLLLHVGGDAAQREQPARGSLGFDTRKGWRLRRPRPRPSRYRPLLAAPGRAPRGSGDAGAGSVAKGGLAGPIHTVLHPWCPVEPKLQLRAARQSSGQSCRLCLSGTPKTSGPRRLPKKRLLHAEASLAQVTYATTSMAFARQEPGRAAERRAANLSELMAAQRALLSALSELPACVPGIESNGESWVRTCRRFFAFPAPSMQPSRTRDAQVVIMAQGLPISSTAARTRPSPVSTRSASGCQRP